MTKYETSLVRQSRMAEEVIHQLIKVSGEAWDVMSMKEYHDVQRIILTGCGDSYCAALAAKPVFEMMTKVRTDVIPCLELSRHMDARQLSCGHNSPLVVGISVSGTVSRVEEALLRAASLGANTVAVTNDPDSPVARAAKHVVKINLPDGIEDGPGALTYNGSLIAVMGLAFRMGRAKNIFPEEELWAIHDEMRGYVSEVCRLLPEMEKQAFEIAQRWKDLRCFDFVGDYGDFATAFFGSAKTLEATGGYTTYDDSEDWCHINFFLYGPRTIGRVFIANSDTPSYTRLKETLAAVELLHSPCIVITNGDREEFSQAFDVFTFPKPKYFWMNPLMQHFAFDLVVGYIAGIKGVGGFGNGNEVFRQDIALDETRIRSSRIDLV